MMTTGWLIAVMVEVGNEPLAVRHFFAVGLEDRARAEWKAVDAAQVMGSVAASPVGGLEPVHVVAELASKTIAAQALKPGEVRSLGRRLPRRWIPLQPGSGSS